MTRNVFGSYEYYRNYTAMDGTVGPFGYYLYYDHRQKEGFREANSDYELNNGSSRLVWDVTDDSLLVLTLDFYDEKHGEPGGLRRREEINPPDSVFEDDGYADTPDSSIGSGSSAIMPRSSIRNSSQRERRSTSRRLADI